MRPGRSTAEILATAALAAPGDRGTVPLAHPAIPPTHLALGLGACGNPTLTGAGLGAATGGDIGSLTGDFGRGALIGACAGAAGGYL